MRLFLTGGTGLIGHYLVQKLRQEHEVYYSFFNHDMQTKDVESHKLDIRQQKKIEEVITKVNPDKVIHCAALVDADKCEREKKLAYETNVQGTKNVLSACSKANSEIIFFSSSFVFEGSGVYTEESSRNPVNYYGETKKKAEDLVIDSPVNSTIIRTDQPYIYSEHATHHDMVKWVVSNLSQDKTLEVFDNWFNNPIYIPDIGRSISELINRNKRGIYHIVGSEYISRYEWAKKIKSGLNLEGELKPVNSREKDSIVAERPNAKLSNDKMKKDLDIKPKSIDSGIRVIKNKTNKDRLLK